MGGVREYDGYYWLGGDDPCDGGTYIGVEGALVGHVVEVHEGGRGVDSRTIPLIPEYTTLARWRGYIGACAWLDGVVGSPAWRSRPRGRRRALLLEAMMAHVGTDPANEHPEYWRHRVGPGETLYATIERYIRDNV